MRDRQHLTTGRNLYALALVAYSAGKYDLAETRIRQSLQILAKMLDQTNPIRANALSLQGSIYQGQGRLAEADRALEQSVLAYRQVYSRPHHNIGFAEFYRAQVAADLGRLDDALAYLDDARINYEASYGKTNPNIGELMVTRASILAKAGRLPEARQQCSEGLDMLFKTVGPDHSFTQGLKKTCDAILQKDT